MLENQRELIKRKKRENKGKKEKRKRAETQRNVVFGSNCLHHTPKKACIYRPFCFLCKNFVRK